MDWKSLIFGSLFAAAAILLWAGLIASSRSGIFRGKYKVEITQKDSPKLFTTNMVAITIMAMMASLMALVLITEALKKYFGE